MAQDSDRETAQTQKLEQRRRLEIDPSELRIKFAPYVQKTLQEVIHVIRIDGGFENDRLLGDLEKLASGKTSVIEGMQLMKNATQRLAAHTKETGNVEAEMAWGLFAAKLRHVHRNLTQPFILIHNPKERNLL